MTEDGLTRECLAPLHSVALADVDESGALRWANAGFLLLLPEHLREAMHLSAARYLLSPRWHELQQRARTGASPCYQGLLTIGDPDGQPQSLRGWAYPQRDGLLLIAEHDVDELMRVSDAAMRLSADLTENQRALMATNRRLSDREVEIHHLSVTDPLTGVGNRRQFDQSLKEAVVTARRQHRPLSLVMVDIDHFKAVNDTYGHAIGDRLLQHFGQALQDGLRSTDTVCRFGGEEFAVVMPDCDLDAACACSESLRIHIEQLPAVEGATRVTATFGVAQWCDGDTAESLLRRADEALYRGKRGGRNCVVCTGSQPPPGADDGPRDAPRKGGAVAMERRRRSCSYPLISGGAGHSRGSR
ncbi:MAG: GGDEF domain-containing protein [Algiphilus sp.]